MPSYGAMRGGGKPTMYLGYGAPGVGNLPVAATNPGNAASNTGLVTDGGVKLGVQFYVGDLYTDLQNFKLYVCVTQGDDSGSAWKGATIS